MYDQKTSASLRDCRSIFKYFTMLTTTGAISEGQNTVEYPVSSTGTGTAPYALWGIGMSEAVYSLQYSEEPSLSAFIQGISFFP